ncbi:MAG: 3-oxoacyl-[acyl-carrier-protein] reductase [Armatimonadetes bacterium]|nr:3-oxoacyl-[acyl-carrier-protein] reductase [Armatimonadota bacterium]
MTDSSDSPAQGSVSLITGARRGIGRVIALRLASLGPVALNDVAAGQEELNAVADEIRAAGGTALAVPGDVTEAESVDAVVGKVMAEFGRLDVLVNNAGITRDGLLLRMTDEQWRTVIEVNLTGAFVCTRAAAKIMLRQRSGRIVNMASVVGVMGNAGQANYSASKAGLIGLTKSTARELASRGITVNAIAPGFIVSPMTDQLSDEAKEKLFSAIPLGRLGTAEDVAEAVAFLASPASSYITGQVLKVDGGMHM